MSNLDKLFKLATESLGDPVSSSDAKANLAVLGGSSQVIEDLAKLYRVRNGFYAFEAALWIYQINPSNPYSIESINRLSELEVYADARGGGIFFASDALGTQFMMNDKGCWALDLETAEAEFIAKDLEGWACSIIEDFDCKTAFSYMHDWQVEHGAIHEGQRLGTKKPFILGGEFSIENLASIDALELMRFRAHLYQQIKSLPPGSPIELKVTE